MPFFSSAGGGPARVELLQVEAKQFELLAGFHYQHPDGNSSFTVTPKILGRTDLTSVPSFFRWFVSPYGRHTLAALLHDCLIEHPKAELATVHGQVPDRRNADDIFLVALGELEVPYIRRHLMWAAVTVSTRLFYSGWAVRLAMGLWMLVAGDGLWLFFSSIQLEWELPPISIRDEHEKLLLAALPVPLVACLFWARSWRAGIWFGYGALLLVPPAFLAYVVYAIYWAVEGILRLFSRGPAPPDFARF